VRIAITGGDGFIGSHLCRYLAARGHRIVALVEDPDRPQAALPAACFRYRFPDDLDLAALAEPFDVLVHGAFAAGGGPKGSALNLEAASYLLGLCRRGAVQRLVFLSSMSAHEGAESRYGRDKLAIERMLSPSRDLAIRPGFVIGNGGVFLRLAKSLAAMPFVPLFYGGRQPIHTIFIEDLCTGVSSAIVEGLSGSLSIGEREPVTVEDFYREILHSLGKRKPFLRLPGLPALWLAQVCETLGMKLPMSSENLLGLKCLVRYDLADDLRRVGLSPRTMGESLSAFHLAELLASKATG
jgi:nucleoside-diphosphate-sugar epimerase